VWERKRATERERHGETGRKWEKERERKRERKREEPLLEVQGGVDAEEALSS